MQQTETKAINKDFLVVYNCFHDDRFGGKASVHVWNYGQDTSECIDDMQKSLDLWKKRWVEYSSKNDEEGKKFAQGYIDKYKKDLESVRVIKSSDYRAEQDKVILTEPKEISEEEFDEMLEILPPLRFTSHGFVMSEFYTESYTSQFYKHGNKYYMAMIDYKRKETWKDV